MDDFISIFFLGLSGGIALVRPKDLVGDSETFSFLEFARWCKGIALLVGDPSSRTLNGLWRRAGTGDNRPKLPTSELGREYIEPVGGPAMLMRCRAEFGGTGIGSSNIDRCGAAGDCDGMGLKSERELLRFFFLTPGLVPLGGGSSPIESSLKFACELWGRMIGSSGGGGEKTVWTGVLSLE